MENRIGATKHNYHVMYKRHPFEEPTTTTINGTMKDIMNVLDAVATERYEVEVIMVVKVD